MPSLTMRPSAHATAAGTGSMRFPWLERLILGEGGWSQSLQGRDQFLRRAVDDLVLLFC